MKNSKDFPETKFQVVAELFKEEIEKRGKLSFKVKINSMFPIIQSNDKVVVEKFVPGLLVIGEIIVFNIGKDLCAHRYIARQEKNGVNEYFTKGDRSFKFDHPVIENKIVGRVTAIERQGKKLNLSRFKYRIMSFCLGAIFKLQWFLFQIVRKFLSPFFKIT
jgi:hypothetical protein